MAKRLHRATLDLVRGIRITFSVGGGGPVVTSLPILIHRICGTVQRLYSLSGLKQVRIRGYTWTPDTVRTRKRTRKGDIIRRRVDLIKCVIGTDTSSIANNYQSTLPTAIVIRERKFGQDQPAVVKPISMTETEKPKSKYRRYRRYIVESRQEISTCLKYLLFVVNFIFWICGLACTILGIYLYAKDYRAVFEAIDFFLNPSILMIICGCVIFIIAFVGCTGALRENVFMLKLFSLCLFFVYICLVVLAFVVFMLFYSDTKNGLSIQSLLQSGVRKYHDNDNMRELMDYLQSNLGCCGASSQGYKDWNSSPLYNCSSANPAPEQCGVPSSCCKAASAVSVPISLQTNPVPFQQIAEQEESPSVSSHSNIVRNPRCGFHAQEKSITDLQNLVYTDGCLQPLQRVFESNAIIIGAVIGAIIIPVCLSVTFANVLAKQIERQRYLLEKEARREERRRRRNRTKFRDPFAGMVPAARTVVGRTDRRATSLDRTLPSEQTADNETRTKLITENEQQSAGPSGPRKIIDPKRQTRARSKSEESTQQHPIRKRSGDPTLPPIPLKKSEQGKGEEGKRKNSEVAGGRAGKAVLDPPVVQERKRRVQKDGDRERRRPRSRDNKTNAYNGPIIVEIESIRHDGPSTEGDGTEGIKGEQATALLQETSTSEERKEGNQRNVTEEGNEEKKE